MELDNFQPKLVVFVGAGASKGAFPECPLMEDYFERAIDLVQAELRKVSPNPEILRIARALVLLDVHQLFRTPNRKATALAGHLWDRFRRLEVWLNPDTDKDFLPVLRRYLRVWKNFDFRGLQGQSILRGENLEQIFLAVDRLPDGALLDKRFRKDAEFERSLFTVFAMLYQRRSANSEGYKFLKRIIQFAQSLDEVLIVNFNYDAFLDHILYHTLNPPNVVSLYGGLLDFEIHPSGIRAKLLKVVRLPIYVVKPHGSITWWYSRGGITEYACTSAGADGLFCLPSFDQPCFFHRTKWYQPKRWIRPILVPPKAQKVFSGPCEWSLKAMLAGVQVAEEIWILGWSMPETDGDLIQHLKQVVRSRQRAINWLRIVDLRPKQSERNELERKAKDIFSPNNFEGHWDGLRTWGGWSRSVLRRGSKF
jgi:hypothetical protein